MVGELIRFVWRLVKALLVPFVWPLQRIRGTVAGEPAVVLLLLLALLCCAVRAVRGGRLAALALIPLSFAWMAFNGRIEGPILFEFSNSHGVTVSDLVSVAGLGISLWRLLPVLFGR